MYSTDRDGPGRVSARDIVDDLEGVDVRYFRGVGPHALACSPALARGVVEACPTVDVVHIHGLFHFTTVATAMTCRRLAVPYVLSPRGVLDPACLGFHEARKRVYLSLLGARDVRRASRVHFTSEGERRKAVSLGIPLASVVVPNCVETGEFDSLPAPGTFRRRHPEIGHRRLVTFLGRITPKKSLDLVLAAAGRLVRSGVDAHVAVVGPADNPRAEAQARTWATQEGLAGRVTFTGLLRGEDKLAALGDSDVFVLPSLSENFGNAVVEALACRVPVVISPEIDIAADIEQAGAGIIVPRDAEVIAAAIGALLDDPDRRHEMGRRGRTFVERNFSPHVVAARMTEAYEAAIGLTPARRP